MGSKQKQFEAMAHAYAPDLYRFGFWLCGQKELSEDMVQETFIRAWRNIDKLRDTKSTKAWLFTILRRELARHFERKKLDTASLDEIDLEYTAGVLDHSLDTDVMAMRQAMSRLPFEYRETLVLQVIEGYSGEEIAGILDIKLNAVMTRLFRARKMLASMFAGDVTGDVAGKEENKLL